MERSPMDGGTTAIESSPFPPYCYVLFWSMPSIPKGLSFVKVITTNIAVNRITASLEKGSLERQP